MGVITKIALWLYPVPAITGIAVWLFIFFSAEAVYIAGAVGVIALGALVFLAKAYKQQQWPFLHTAK